MFYNQLEPYGNNKRLYGFSFIIRYLLKKIIRDIIRCRKDTRFIEYTMYYIGFLSENLSLKAL